MNSTHAGPGHARPPKRLVVCYLLSYYSPDYVRTRTLTKGLRRLHWITLYECRNTSKGIWRYAETLGKLISVRIRHHPDSYILGFRGYELFWFVRLITAGRPLILDHLMSPYDSLINERRSLPRGSLLMRLIFAYERSILWASNVVLTDTDLHCLYFQGLFRLPASKFVAVPVGTDEDAFVRPARPAKTRATGPFEVLFFGSFLPLHGIEVILEAAAALPADTVHFTLIGGGELGRGALEASISRLGLRSVSHLKWVAFEELPDYIARSDLGLGGPFGNTGQAQRVITAKTFQFLAMAKPVVVGMTHLDSGFLNRVNCLLVPQGDPKALADSISWARRHRAELARIGRRGYDLYRSRYSLTQVSSKLADILTR